ncbi:MAG: ABC transporter substrate-binding protein [Phycisphaerae bacterium]
MNRKDDHLIRREAAARLPAGVMVVALLSLVSTIAVFAWPIERPQGLRLWLTARMHHQLYEPSVATWNQSEIPPITMTLLSQEALQQRMLSAFLARTDVAELLEVERRNAARAFGGPLESVGFVDLTDRLREEGLDTAINTASFSPWSTRGRIFGLPHDVHPVMLGYRADIVEAAGIDVSQIETWEDYVRVMSPLMGKRGADGKPERYILNLWESHGDVVEVLMLQSGGGLFDQAGKLVIDQETNARVISQIVAWFSGPDRIAADAPYFSSAGNKLLLDGYVLASFLPDWMCNIWRYEIPQLAGKVKLMPLPAWQRGGRRTSVWGGTMMGISRTAPDIEAAWRFAKHLYLSPELARELYTRGDIITPVKTLWSDKIYDQPDAYFGNQPKGRLYINLAPDVPSRSSSPYGKLAMERVQSAVVNLHTYARANDKFSVEELLPEARRLLAAAHAEVASHVNRNIFLAESAGGAQ